MEPQTYASKSTAIRGAKRSGIKAPHIEKTEKGRWIISDLVKHAPLHKANNVVATAPVSVEQASSAIDLSKPELIVPKRAGGSQTYKDLESIAPPKSTIAAPVAFVWAFLDLNPNMSRKEAVSILVQHGCNINMCRSQYQLWRAAGGVSRKK